VNLEVTLILALSVVSTASAGVASALARPAPPPAPTAAAGTSPCAMRDALVAGANLVALPLVAWLVARPAALGEATAGVVLAAAAPAGSTGPLLAKLAGGDARAAARPFVPLALGGAASALVVTFALDPSGLGAVARAAAIVLLASAGPLVLGQQLGSRRPALAGRLAGWLSGSSVVLLLATMALLAARHAHRATLAALAASAVVVALSFAIGKLGRTRGEVLALAQVSAVRNLTLVLVVLAAVGAPAAATAAALSYGLVMYVGAAAVALGARYSAA
jgi:hypothetical protein